MSDIIEVFISYSKQDKELRDGLLAHLHPLEREGIITWHDRQILPGTEWDEEIKARLNSADIILLLISADFLATDYCIQVEIPEALRRHEAGEATVMPVILRSCGWNYTPLAKIQAYPEKAKPVVSWTYIDDAYTNVVDGVYLAATKIKERRSQPQAERERIQQKQQQSKGQDKLRQAEQLGQQQTVEEARPKQQELERQQQEQLKQESAKNQQQAELQNQSSDTLQGNYAQLEALLKAGQWRKADQETAKQLLKAIGRHEEGWLRVEDIQQLPCADLLTIDQLWVKYSDGKFGFSVQKKIWQKHGCPTEFNQQWEQFGAEVGWRVGNDMKSHNELTFDTSAPDGHLPGISLSGFGFGYADEGWLGWNWWGVEFVARARTCGLDNAQIEALSITPTDPATKGNYAQLEALLKARKWREADGETAKQMLEVMGRQQEGWLRVEDIQQLPCADLRIIDQLWVKYSDGQFGFSVQRKIWQKYGSPVEDKGQLVKFGEKVGWKHRGIFKYHWKTQPELSFTPQAPDGHLPVITGVRGGKSGGYLVWYEHYSVYDCEIMFISLAQRLISCSI